MDQQLFTIVIFSEIHVGKLNEFTIIFTRRGLNIHSLTCSPETIPGIQKVTLTCQATRHQMERVVAALEKRIDVVRAFLYTDSDLIYEEVAIYKVPTFKLIDGGRLEDILRRHSARILDINQSYTVISKTGHERETQALYEELKQYDLFQFARSGRVCVSRAPIDHLKLHLKEQDLRKLSSPKA